MNCLDCGAACVHWSDSGLGSFGWGCLDCKLFWFGTGPDNQEWASRPLDEEVPRGGRMGRPVTRSVLFEPHQDDAVLFAAFTCCRYRPLVVTVLASQVQADRGTGITNEQRTAENVCALRTLFCDSEQWPFPDSDPDWHSIMRELVKFDRTEEPEIVFAPAIEHSGHEHHNSLGVLAQKVFGDRVQPYLTYRRGHGRSIGHEVVPEPEWIARKLRALACFESQIREPSTRPWFLDSLREWVPE